jgi:hypothetical protein
MGILRSRKRGHNGPPGGHPSPLVVGTARRGPEGSGQVPLRSRGDRADEEYDAHYRRAIPADVVSVRNGVADRSRGTGASPCTRR